MTHGALAGAKARVVILFALVALLIAAIEFAERGALEHALHLTVVHSLFQTIVWDAFPFLVLGAGVSAFIETVIHHDRLSRFLADSLAGRVTAALVGVVLPVCDCGTAPIARSLRHKGVSESVAFTYVLAAPTVNIVALSSTFVAFHESFLWVAMRAGGAWVIALSAGFLTRFREDGLTETWVLSKPPAPVAARTEKWAHFADHTVSELFAIGPFFAASALLAAVAQAFWPIRAVTQFTQHSIWSIPLLMGLGATLSLCSEADAFVAVALSSLFSPGAILAFLLIGQTVDVRNLLLMPSVFGKRTLATGFLMVAALVFIMALAVNRVLTGGFA